MGLSCLLCVYYTYFNLCSSGVILATAFLQVIDQIVGKAGALDETSRLTTTWHSAIPECGIEGGDQKIKRHHNEGVSLTLLSKS